MSPNGKFAVCVTLALILTYFIGIILVAILV